MNPGMQSRITPEIAEALMRRRMGGVGGGTGAPATMQRMAPNQMGGPMGPSQSPLQNPPQAVQSAGLPQPASPSGQAAGAAPTTSSSGQGGGSSTNPNATLMKALLQRLVADL